MGAILDITMLNAQVGAMRNELRALTDLVQELSLRLGDVTGEARYMSREQAQATLHIGRSTILKLLARKEIKGYKDDSGRWQIPVESVREYQKRYRMA